VVRDPAEHDVEVAWMSHVPHVMAFAFSDALNAAPAGAAEVAGAGFGDFTRIARSEPELWGDILSANRKALSAPLQAVGDALARLGRAIEANDADALERAISGARDSLSRFPRCGASDPDDSGEGHPQSALTENSRPDRVK
jgi:prephenate dehydrogenase